MKDINKTLLKSQQGELDAVLMYQAISKRIKDPELKKIILDIASDEGRHAATFFKLTGVTLKPRKFKAILLPILMFLFGKKLVFKVIADQEHEAAYKYAPIVKLYPEVMSVLVDEDIHGDRMMDISKKL